MASVTRALSRIKEDLGPFLPDEAIESACREAGHDWRERVLGPAATVHLLVLQVLHLNTAITALRHLAKVAFCAAAYCEARKRLPLAAVQALLRRSSQAMRQAAAEATPGLWRGLRAYLVDGSSTIAPDTPALDAAFGHPTGQKKGCGFPVPKVLGLFDAFTGMVVELLSFPLFTHDMSKASLLHPLLSAGDLLVGDRGFCSFAHLALLRLRGALGLFRMHQARAVDFRRHGKGKPKGKGSNNGRVAGGELVRKLGKRDRVVLWRRPAAHNRPAWMSREQFELLPQTLEVRELRYDIPRKGQRTLCVTVATTLLDPELYPKGEIAALYGIRWQVETHFAELKTTLKMRRLKCKTPDGVLKELAAYCLLYNLVHAVMCSAAAAQGVDPDRISFIDALRWLQSAEPGEPLCELVVNPRREGRHEPRVIKDLQDTYRKMSRSRKELRRKPALAKR